LLEKEKTAIFKVVISVDKSVVFGAYEFNFSNVIISDVNNTNIQSISLEAGKLNVTPKPITITADAATKVYGESDAELTYQITSGSLVSGDVLNGSLSRAEGEDVGDYAIASTLSNANYEITFVPASLSITAKLITITADAATKVYGESDAELTYQITSGSLVSGDVLNGSLSRAEGEDVGDYVITSTLSNANYEITFVPASLSITAKLITITADAVTKVYGESDPELTYQITSGSLVSGDVLNGSLSRAEGEDVGDYVITSTVSNANYEITFIEAVFTITGTLDIKEENLIKSISVYPNPTSSFLKIQMNNSLKVKNLLIYNILGKEILKITKDYGVINISKFATGIYFLKINTDKGAIIKKIIKE
jgi:SHS2 domain-containing protein